MSLAVGKHHFPKLRHYRNHGPVIPREIGLGNRCKIVDNVFFFRTDMLLFQFVPRVKPGSGVVLSFFVVVDTDL